jgi:ABC-type branched-subunit amino acid transport system permease subunit
MTKNRIIYAVLVVVLAGMAALSGAAVGGVVVYRTLSQVKSANLNNGHQHH